MIKVEDNRTVSVPSDENWDNLKWLAKQPIRKLGADEGGSLLIFPQSFGEYGDKIGDEYIFSIKGENQIQTGNIMGFIGYNGTEVNICSRFAQKEGDYFLHYMLQKVFAINLFDLKHDFDKESIFDFLIFLFPAFLKRALRQGLYKEYQTRQYNDANVKGRVDVNRHIRLNTPFGGKIAYSTREYSFDNKVTQLIRHTIEFIASHPLGGNILNTDEETKEAVGMINTATPSYQRNDRSRIINKNLKPTAHPYFIDYLDLQRLCLQILRHDEIKYGNDKEQVYGVLFDGAWLWEEYLATILEPKNYTHPRSGVDYVGKYVFTNPRRVLAQPDFFKEGIAVFDAKYKMHESLFDRKQREDRFQLLAYMYVFNVDVSGLIVPVSIGEEQLIKGEINGRGGQLYLIGMGVDKEVLCFNDYVDEMNREEERFLASIGAISSTR